MINFIWQLIKIGIGILLILGLSYILRILALAYRTAKKMAKSTPESICDTCENLERKSHKDACIYQCKLKNFGYDNPPEICCNYKKKSGD